MPSLQEALDNFFAHMAKPIVAAAALEQKRHGRGIMFVGPFGGPHDPAKGVPFKFVPLEEMRSTGMSWQAIESVERYDLTRECVVYLDRGEFCKLLKVPLNMGQVAWSEAA